MHDAKPEIIKEKNHQIHIVISKCKDIEKMKTLSDDVIDIFRTLYTITAEKNLGQLIY